MKTKNERLIEAAFGGIASFLLVMTILSDLDAGTVGGRGVEHSRNMEPILFWFNIWVFGVLSLISFVYACYCLYDAFRKK